MITAPAYQGQSIGVFGLARSGLATVHALVASGAMVFAWDDNATAREAVSACVEDLYAMDFSRLDALVLAPGVPLTHPVPHPLVMKAQASGTPLISDLDVFQAARATLPDHKVVGITGTNGKSTTTALIGHILQQADVPAAVGGNIGTGVLALNPLPAGGMYVFELSSFQLDLCQALACDVAVLLNMSPDHLDRHGTMDRYVAAKKRLFDMQAPSGVSIIGVDDDHCRSIAADNQNAVPVSVMSRLDKGVSVENSILISGLNGGWSIDLSSIASLQGSHNHQNAAAAVAAFQSLGLGVDDIARGLESFPGLEHRQELISFQSGITVVNDSKATNVDAAVRALNTFDKIRWIAGGRSKDKDFAGLANAVTSVRKAYLMGEDGDAIAAVLPPELSRSVRATMLDALAEALGDAETGDTVLLSPACTAFDQFPDFEKRGEAFKNAVMKAGGHRS